MHGLLHEDRLRQEIGCPGLPHSKSVSEEYRVWSGRSLKKETTILWCTCKAAELET